MYRLLLKSKGCIFRTAQERDVITYLLPACASSIIATILTSCSRDVEGAFANRAVSSFPNFDYALKMPSKGPGSNYFCVYGVFLFGELRYLIFTTHRVKRQIASYMLSCLFAVKKRQF